MSKPDTIKKHLTDAIDAYEMQAISHKKALEVANSNYIGDVLRDQLQKESENHAIALSRISQNLKFASDEVKALNEKAHLKLSSPVSTEALNALQVLSMRSDVSAREIESFQHRYGDNLNVLAALQEIAGKHGITIKTVLEEKANGSDGLTQSGILSALDDLQTHVEQLRAGIDADKGLLSLAITHNLAGKRIDALGGHLDAIASYAD